MTKRTLSLFFLFLFTSSLFSQTNDSLFLESAKAKKKYKLAGINVTGADFTDKGVIGLLSGLTVGEEITIPSDKTSDVIKKLWKQGLFEDIQLHVDRIEGDNIYLKIH